jgi:hypothetical protein
LSSSFFVADGLWVLRRYAVVYVVGSEQLQSAYIVLGGTWWFTLLEQLRSAYIVLARGWRTCDLSIPNNLHVWIINLLTFVSNPRDARRCIMSPMKSSKFCQNGAFKCDEESRTLQLVSDQFPKPPPWMRSGGQDSPKTMGKSPKSWTSTDYFWNSTTSSVTSGRFQPGFVKITFFLEENVYWVIWSPLHHANSKFCSSDFCKRRLAMRSMS